jgi:hypothetical protein
MTKIDFLRPKSISFPVRFLIKEQWPKTTVLITQSQIILVSIWWVHQGGFYMLVSCNQARFGRWMESAASICLPVSPLGVVARELLVCEGGETVDGVGSPSLVVIPEDTGG